MLIHLAWRNLWRNRRRSWLAAGGMGFATFLLVFMVALNNGAFEMMADLTAKLLTGHLQVQAEGYQDNPQVDLTLKKLDQLTRSVKSQATDTGWRSISARAEASALVSVGELSFGAQIIGIEPAKEKQWLAIAQMGRKGQFLADAPSSPTERSDRTEAYIGDILARNLGLDIGAELMILGTAKAGGMAAVVATLVGTFKTGQAAIDRSLAFIPLNSFRQAWSLGPDEAHKLVAVIEPFSFDGFPQIDIDTPGIVVLKWNELMPEVEQLLAVKLFGIVALFAILSMIILFSIVASFVIVVNERIPEFGVMTALGMRPGRVILMLQIESFWLALLGLGIGLLLSCGLIEIASAMGIPLPDMYSAFVAIMNIPDRIYPQLNWYSIYAACLIMVISTQLASLIPALKLRRLKPITSMRETF